jgi:hypothetical protein
VTERRERATVATAAAGARVPIALPGASQGAFAFAAVGNRALSRSIADRADRRRLLQRDRQPVSFTAFRLDDPNAWPGILEHPEATDVERGYVLRHLASGRQAIAQRLTGDRVQQSGKFHMESVGTKPDSPKGWKYIGKTPLKQLAGSVDRIDGILVRELASEGNVSTVATHDGTFTLGAGLRAGGGHLEAVMDRFLAGAPEVRARLGALGFGRAPRDKGTDWYYIGSDGVLSWGGAATARARTDDVLLNGIADLLEEPGVHEQFGKAQIDHLTSALKASLPERLRDTWSDVGIAVAAHINAWLPTLGPATFASLYLGNGDSGLGIARSWATTAGVIRGKSRIVGGHNVQTSSPLRGDGHFDAFGHGVGEKGYVLKALRAAGTEVTMTLEQIEADPGGSTFWSLETDAPKPGVAARWLRVPGM